jgi:hypothetical protein
MSCQRILFFLFTLLLGGMIGWFYFSYRPDNPRRRLLLAWLNHPASHPDLRVLAASRCGSAPFLFPTDGMIGFLWDDSFRIGHRHQGIDIFGGSEPGVTPVFAAYSGYLSRLPEWKASLIIRIPHDPLSPDRQIWLYYTHLADQNGESFIAPDFPPGTTERYIEAGTFLGYQGNYSGNPLRPVGVHLHFSVVKDDGHGHFKNELDIRNTYDPSPYFGLALNARVNRDRVPLCEEGTP